MRVRFLIVTARDALSSPGWTVDAMALQPATIATPVPTQLPTPAPSAIPTDTPTPEGGIWTTYADTDPLLTYGDGIWETFEVASATGGTLTGSAASGATLTAHFEGTGIRVIYAKGPEGQAFSAQVDDSVVQAADGYDAAYSYGHVLALDALPDGQHTLTVTNGDGAIWIEAVEVRGTLLDELALTPTPTVMETPAPTATATPASPWTMVADTDPLLLFANGVWETYDVAAAAGGTLTGSADPGATLTVHFEGTGIRIVYSRGPEGGAFSAQVDDGSAVTTDGYGETYTYGHVVAVEELPIGQHTLTVTNGEGAIWIEAIEIQGRLSQHGIVVLDISSQVPASTSEAGFYLGQESKNLSMVSSTSDDNWVYDSIEWPAQNASEMPIVGTCYDVVEQGEGVQHANMSSSNDDYSPPWISFWGNTSDPGVTEYQSCFGGTEICAQVCPEADFVRAYFGWGSWPKTVDGDYVATWKIGCRKIGSLSITRLYPFARQKRVGKIS